MLIEDVPLPVEKGCPVMPLVQRSRHCWAVVLAGGDGTRLQELTHKISGDFRPKQFCPVFGEQSLLTQTRARVESLFDIDRELFLVTRVHERFYRDDLWDVDASRVIVQPLNRGTGVAMALALLHILQRDGNAVVVFVPSDHYYDDVDAFGRAIRSAVSGAEQYPDSIILLGAEARYPEVEYGWIEHDPVLARAPGPLLRVKRFWEKPTLPRARALLRRGCLWNTFVTVGHVDALVDLFCSEAPNLLLSIDEALAGDELEAGYRQIHAIDFSRQILAPQPNRLLVIRDATSGWADLGSPGRVIDLLARNNIQPVWLRDWHASQVTSKPYAAENCPAS